MGLFRHFFSCLSFLFSFSLSLGDGPIQTEILSQRAVKSKTTNQPIIRNVYSQLSAHSVYPFNCILYNSLIRIYNVSLTLKAPSTTAADDIHKYFFHCFSEKISLDVSSESSGSSGSHEKSSLKKIKIKNYNVVCCNFCLALSLLMEVLEKK